MEIRFTHVSALRAISSKHFDSISIKIKLNYITAFTKLKIERVQSLKRLRVIFLKKSSSHFLKTPCRSLKIHHKIQYGIHLNAKARSWELC